MVSVADAGKGWKNDVTMHLYRFIVFSFLNPVKDLVQTSTAVEGHAEIYPSCFPPFSVQEFNDIIGEEYGLFVTNGDARQIPIVFHTTASNRNRYLGAYHEFHYSGGDLPSVPIPNVAQTQRNQRLQDPDNKQGRTYPDNFWSSVCKTWHTFKPGEQNREGKREGMPQKISFEISIKVVLMGHLFLTKCPGLLGGKSYPGTNMNRAVFEAQITANHTMGELFRDYKTFQNYVKNCERSVLQLRNYPYVDLINNNEHERLTCLEKVKLCENFQLGGANDDGVDEELKEKISQSLREGKLLPILNVGLLGMNDEYIEFMIKLENIYRATVDNEWDGVPVTYIKTCKEIENT